MTDNRVIGEKSVWGSQSFTIAQFPNAFERLYDSPLEVTQIWPSLEDAEYYAKVKPIPSEWYDKIDTLKGDELKEFYNTVEYLVVRSSSKSYKGQIICVVSDDNSVDVYKICEDKSLITTDNPLGRYLEDMGEFNGGKIAYTE